MSRIEELEKQIQGLKNELEWEKQKQELGSPFKRKERYWSINSYGLINDYEWTNHNFDIDRYSQGHVFKTREEAIRERDRRILLTRFRQFRDKCNGDWKPDFKDYDECKYAINYDWYDGAFYCYEHRCIEQITQLGYFKHKEDVKRAVKLFGDEIKRLYVEVD